MCHFNKQTKNNSRSEKWRHSSSQQTTQGVVWISAQMFCFSLSCLRNCELRNNTTEKKPTHTPGKTKKMHTACKTHTHVYPRVVLRTWCNTTAGNISSYEKLRCRSPSKTWLFSFWRLRDYTQWSHIFIQRFDQKFSRADSSYEEEPCF